MKKLNIQVNEGEIKGYDLKHLKYEKNMDPKKRDLKTKQLKV